MDWNALIGKQVLVQFKDPVLLAAKPAKGQGAGVAAHYLSTPEGEIPAMLPALAVSIVSHGEDRVSMEYDNGAGDECVLHLAKAAILAVTEVRTTRRVLSLASH